MRSTLLDTITLIVTAVAVGIVTALVVIFWWGLV